MNINVFFVDLPEHVNGFFLNSQNAISILINKDLPQEQRKIICAHELGHALLHSCVNSILYEDDSDYIEKLEYEANIFSKFLLE